MSCPTSDQFPKTQSHGGTPPMLRLGTGSGTAMMFSAFARLSSSAVPSAKKRNDRGRDCAILGLEGSRLLCPRLFLAAVGRPRHRVKLRKFVRCRGLPEVQGSLKISGRDMEFTLTSVCIAF